MRPKKPKALKNLQGNPGHRKEKKWNNANFDHNSDKKFGVPHGLDKVVREKFRAFVAYLMENNIAVDFYRFRVERYAECLQMAFEAKKALKKEGFIIPGAREAKTNPNHRVWVDNCRIAGDIEDKFKRLLDGVEPPESENDPMEEYLKLGGKPRVVKK